MELENYVKYNLSRKRSFLAQIRLGTLAIKIETGYEKLPPENRLCEFCHTNEIEDEKHFVFVSLSIQNGSMMLRVTYKS